MRRNKSLIYIVISIIAHLLLLLLLQISRESDVLIQSEKILQEDNRLVFELIETPDVRDQIPDTESNLVSDKNTVASDLNETELPNSDTPFQIGDTALKSFKDKIVKQIQEEQQSKSSKESISDILADIQKSKTTFMEDYKNRKEMLKIAQIKPEFNQELSKAKKKGGMSFNTYAWDFAPYMLSLKRKVQNHINPPYAFSRLGAIDGNTLIRFKIMQDGSLQDLEIVGSDAHYTLDDTSTRAIQYSAPFVPLPSNFPEPYLEVTALFSYLIGNK